MGEVSEVNIGENTWCSSGNAHGTEWSKKWKSSFCLVTDYVVFLNCLCHVYLFCSFSFLHSFPSESTIIVGSFSYLVDAVVLKTMFWWCSFTIQLLIAMASLCCTIEIVPVVVVSAAAIYSCSYCFFSLATNFPFLFHFLVSLFLVPGRIFPVLPCVTVVSFFIFGIETLQFWLPCLFIKRMEDYCQRQFWLPCLVLFPSCHHTTVPYLSNQMLVLLLLLLLM